MCVSIPQRPQRGGAQCVSRRIPLTTWVDGSCLILILILISRLFDFDSHRPVRWVNLTGRLPEPPHKAPIFTHFAASGGEVGENGKRERGTLL